VPKQRLRCSSASVRVADGGIGAVQSANCLLVAALKPEAHDAVSSALGHRVPAYADSANTSATEIESSFTAPFYSTGQKALCERNPLRIDGKPAAPIQYGVDGPSRNCRRGRRHLVEEAGWRNC
jgi:hypothetical protein